MAKSRIYCQDCPVRDYCESKKEAYRNGEFEVSEPKKCPLLCAVAIERIANKNSA